MHQCHFKVWEVILYTGSYYWEMFAPYIFTPFPPINNGHILTEHILDGATLFEGGNGWK